MAAFDFPAAPAPGDEYTTNGITYTWSGEAWVINKFPVLPLAGPVVQIKRTPTNNNPPTALKEGELAIEMGVPLRLWVGVPPALDPSGMKIVADSGADPYVNITGDTMTGNLVIQKANPSLILDKADAGTQSNSVKGMLNGALRWVEYYGTASAETGGNAGSDYVLQAADDAGNTIAPPILKGLRSTNRLQVAGDPIAPLDIVTKQYADALLSVPASARMMENLVINGDMSISQEQIDASTGGIGTGVNKYACDLWQIGNVNGAGGQLFGQRGSTAFGGPGRSMPKYLSITASPGVAWGAGAGDYALLTHHIEGARWSRLNYGSGAGNAQPINVSFWMTHASLNNLTGCFSIRNGTVTRAYIHDFVYNAPVNNWQFFSFIVPGCPDGNWFNDFQLGAYLGWCFGAGANYKQAAVDAWTDTTAQQKFASNSISNFFPTTNFSLWITGVCILPGNIPITAAQSLLMQRGPAYESVLVHRYLRRIKWTAEGYAAGSNMRANSQTHGITAMRATPGVTRLGVGSMTNIRGPNDQQFAACIPMSEQAISIQIEAAGAGYAQAQGFEDLISARY